MLVNPVLVKYEDDSLTHYGVMGMKWGVRKDREKTSSYTDSPFSERRNAKIQKITSRMMANQQAMRKAQSCRDFRRGNWPNKPEVWLGRIHRELHWVFIGFYVEKTGV